VTAVGRVAIREIAEVLPRRRLKLRLSDGSIVVRDFSTLVGGVFDRFVEPRYFARVRVIQGALTWPGSAGWNPYQVVDFSPDGVIWGRCRMPPTTRRPPSTMVFGDRPPKGVPMGVFRARLARRVLNAVIKGFDGSKPSITRLRAAADAALDVGIKLSRRTLAKLEDASDIEAYLRAKRRSTGKAVSLDEWLKSPAMRDIAPALAKRRKRR
jgi:Protein of unknown function (DUF2442)